jgi:drug/metabolite transporter (DMT)-like permease
MSNPTYQSGETNPSLGYLFAGLSAVTGAVLIVTGKFVLYTISPLALNAIIFPVGAVVLGLAMIPGKRWKRIGKMDRKGWGWTMAFSLLACVAIWAHWAGIKMMDPTLASFLNRSETLVTISLGIGLLGERFTRGEALGGFLVLGGIVLMRFTLRAEYSTGFWVVLFSAVCFGTAEFFAKIAVRYVDPLTIAFLRTVTTSVFFWIMVSAVGTSFEGAGSVWWALIILVFAGPVLVRPIYLYALKHLEVSKVALISQSQPVFVGILALVALSQLPAPREIAGGLLVIGGCFLIILGRKKAKPANPNKGMVSQS